MGGPSRTVDSGKFNTLSSAESVVGDSSVHTSSEGYEVAPQHDYDQDSHYLTGQLRVSEDMIMAATKHIDDMHALMADYCWRALMAHGSSDGGFSMDDFHNLKVRVSVMRTDYQQLLTNRDYLLRMGDMYHEALREKESEVDRLTHELESTRGFLRGTPIALRESEFRSEKIRQRSTTSILVGSQVYPSVTLLGVVDDWEEEYPLIEEHEEYPGSLMSMESYDLEADELPSTSIFETVKHSHMHGDSRAKDNFEDTSICVPRVVELHVEVDIVVHPGSMM
jgi:hypothetical protein